MSIVVNWIGHQFGHQRCTHHAALLAELEQLPPLPPTSITTKRPISMWTPAPQIVQVGSIECLLCRGCGVLAWRGSTVFNHDSNAAYCFECTPVALSA
ncbi:MAG: hypothetical protein ACJ789_14915 [Thermomicrobiales bacterium]